ncbi:hypothetical protein BT96DRAFT_1000995 [Gymnopus androsaceus JB14]|uniref:Uncharacterized protein n=1 Tax=Gymnopus androsaceus JB14 TaxID=1447944 RepID=A0A6A4H1Y8_9AGAR|nr:hypothetical protein BT96DRAFT_1000995 [Gymnopus androsaceus JB14]
MYLPSLFTFANTIHTWTPTQNLAAGTTSRSSPDACNDINRCRTLFQILSSCISVLIACIWVSVHPNVPSRNDSLWVTSRRKAGLMLVTLLAPEIMILWAVRQWFASRELYKMYKDKGWTRTHASFALMGGFALYNGDEFVSILRHAQPPDAAPGTLLAHHVYVIGRIREAELSDRSRSDSFSKLVVVSQTTWFVVQLLARWANKLPITLLEVMTVAFAAMNIIIYIL